MSNNNNRRKAITIAALSGAVVAATGAGVSFASTMAPSRRTKGEGAPVEVSLDILEPGRLSIVAWRRKPVWLLSRTEEMLATLDLNQEDLSDPDSESSLQPEYCKNPTRSIKRVLFVAIGICTHLGCSPGSDLPTGFLCACHGSFFDVAGRVKKGSPAPTNLSIPEYYFTESNTLVIGVSGPN